MNLRSKILFYNKSLNTVLDGRFTPVKDGQGRWFLHSTKERRAG